MRKYLILFFLISANYLTSLNIKNNKDFVVCNLYGQLGNQLFNIASTLAYSWDYNVEAFFPDLARNDLNIPTNKKKIFFRVNALPLLYKPLNVHRSFKAYRYTKIPYKPAQHLEGYFFSWQYFHHHREKILETFAPSDEESVYLKSKFFELLSHPLTVGVHVRTFNKEWNDSIPFVGMDYYVKAMNLFPEDALFVIFSDRINWCKVHFSDIKKNMIFIDGQDHVDDLYLMSMLKNNIIGNSSYSWWAAYLNKNPSKIVVAPNIFVKVGTLTYHSNLPEWITLEIPPNGEYPNDIKNYDEFSKSIDTQ